MSLINQMLKDLEDRRGGDGKVQHEMLTQRHHSIWPWLLVGVLAIATGVLAVMLLQKPAAITATEPTIDVASETAAADSATAERQLPTVAVATPPEKTEPAQLEPVIESPKPGPARTPAKPVESRVETPQPVVSTPQAVTTDTVENGEEGSFSIAPTRLSPMDQANASFERGYVAMQRKDYRGATHEFVAGLDVIPDDDDARLALYQALRRQGRVAEAEGVLENGLIEAREPHRFAALLARMYMARGQLEEASRILRVSPPDVNRDPEYFVLWGALLQQLGLYEEALPIYQKLVAEDPANSQWIAGLGIAHQQTGDNESAVENYRQALNIGGLAPAVESYISGQLEQLAPEED